MLLPESVTGAEGKAANTSPYKNEINGWYPSISSGLDYHNLDVKITVGYYDHILPHANRHCRTYTWAGAYHDLGTLLEHRVLHYTFSCVWGLPYESVIIFTYLKIARLIFITFILFTCSCFLTSCAR